MKFKFSIITISLLFLITLGLSAQTEIREFDANGVQVILKKVPNEVVAVRLYIRGGTANYPVEKQGIENLAFELAMFGGTEERTADEIASSAQNLGVGISAKSGYDYGYMGMTALKIFWDESWALWIESVTKPAMEETAFNRIRNEVFARQRRSDASPEEHIKELSMAYTYAGTDYEKLPAGTEGSLYDLALEDVKSHYQKVLTKSNCFLVVVGDIAQEDIEQKVSATFAEIPIGTATEIDSEIVVESPGANIKHSDLEINHIQGRMPAPDRYSKGGIENMMAMSLLSDRFAALTQRDYDMVYAPTAVAGNLHRSASNELYVASANPAKSIDMIVDELNRIKKEGFTKSELERKKPAFLTYHYLGQETLDAQAHALGDAEARSDWRLSQGLTSSVKGMSLDSLNAVFRDYNNWINWTYLGNSSQVQSEDFKQPATVDPGNLENKQD